MGLSLSILAAARAKSMGIASAIAVLQRPTYLHLLEHVGIDRAFSPRATAVAQIRQLLDVSPVRLLASLAVDVADVFEVHVPENAVEVLGKPLREVRFPQRTIVAAIQRGDQVRVPGAEDAIAAGDTAVIIGPAGVRDDLERVIAIR